MKLKIGDRVRVISLPDLAEANVVKVRIGMTGTVKELREIRAGVEFDKDINGHNGHWGGKDGYCWYMLYERLEKIKEEETNKRKPFIPRFCQEYFYLDMENIGGESLLADVRVDIWAGDIGGYGLLALGNVFQSGEEALENKDKVLEKLRKLRRGE